ncbi:hypothetical protein [Pedobacter suwonensis]|uniref:hypothetical protein n=1 Tax=Pedobacter suwonensis TaxID=332999 RepID=UPI0011AB1333|nr:hypothetical protein [Pedobacter suwonensis]
MAVPVGFASPAPVPAPMKNREHPLRSGLGGKTGNTIKGFIANAGTGSASKNGLQLNKPDSSG